MLQSCANKGTLSNQWNLTGNATNIWIMRNVKWLGNETDNGSSMLVDNYIFNWYYYMTGCIAAQRRWMNEWQDSVTSMESLTYKMKYMQRNNLYKSDINLKISNIFIYIYIGAVDIDWFGTFAPPAVLKDDLLFIKQRLLLNCCKQVYFFGLATISMTAKWKYHACWTLVHVLSFTHTILLMMMMMITIDPCWYWKCCLPNIRGGKLR